MGERISHLTKTRKDNQKYATENTDQLPPFHNIERITVNLLIYYA